MASMETCDDLFSRVVRLRDGVCQEEGCEVRGLANLECAHLIRRGYLRTRCDERNAVALCRVHHHYYTRHPFEWAQWCRDHLGGSYELLHDLATGKDMPLIIPRPDWTEIAADLRVRLRALEAA